MRFSGGFVRKLKVPSDRPIPFSASHIVLEDSRKECGLCFEKATFRRSKLQLRRKTFRECLLDDIDILFRTGNGRA